MTRLESQIRELSPSVKDALYRRLMFAEELAWLREEKRKGMVIGFEVELTDQELPGFALIAIQRHTVIAFVSDRDESPRLILFPALETLFDPGFELLDLIVTRKEFNDAAFIGTPTGHGRFGDLVKDLTPPNRRVDISDTVMDQIAAIIKQEETERDSEAPVSKPSPEPAKPMAPPMDEPEEPNYEDVPPDDYDEPDDFEEPDYSQYESGDDYYDDYDDGYDDGYDDEPEPPAPEPPKTRSGQLKDAWSKKTFNSLSDVTDFVVMRLNVNRALAVTLANKAMQSNVSPEFRIELAVKIFCKLMDEGSI